MCSLLTPVVVEVHDPIPSQRVRACMFSECLIVNKVNAAGRQGHNGRIRISIRFVAVTVYRALPGDVERQYG